MSSFFPESHILDGRARLRCDNFLVRNYPIEFESRPQVEQVAQTRARARLINPGYRYQSRSVESLYERSVSHDASNAGISAPRPSP